MVEAPLSLYNDFVRPEWLDYNQHMTEGFYGVAFGNASDAFIDFARLDAAYRARTQGAVYTVETHICFLRELKKGAPLRFTTQLLGHDTRRMHIFHQMFHADEGFLAATFEAMMLHVDQRVGRVAPMPPEIVAWLGEILAAHAMLPWPEQVGRVIQRLNRS
jgi:acyl-CoA thioester hydrolase